MRYPIDVQTTEKFLGHLTAHDRAQRQLIQALTILLTAAMDEMGMEDTEWYDEAKKLLNLQKQINVDHENRIFNDKNGHGDTPMGAEDNVKLNEVEKSFGTEMSEEEMARHFSEKSKPKKPRRLKEMSEEEINRAPVHELEKLVEQAEIEEVEQDNSSDIYKIKSRVQNLAVGISGGNLTPVGEMMVNSFVHVIKDLYDFADTVQDKGLRDSLRQKIRKHEDMPGNLISAASANTRGKK